MANLPPEILLLIADHLLWPRDRLRLLLVCRRWYDLLLPKAHEHVGLRGNVYPLARTIQNNPRIGRVIRSLSLQWWDYTRPMTCDVQPCQEILRKASPTEEYRAKWEEDLARGSADAWLAILAPYLESVTEMRLTYGGCSEYFFPMVGRAVTKEAPFDSLPGLQRLESLRVIKDRDDGKAPSYYASEFEPFVHLPALRKVFFESVGEEERHSHWTFSKPADKANIKELEFSMSNGTYGFKDIITQCAGLESLVYHHEDYVVWGEQAWDFHSYAFYKSLSTQKHSLRVLHLHNNGKYNYMGFVDDDIELDPEYKRFGSLSEFTQLRDLRIPLKTLLQYGRTDRPAVSLEDVLPPSLEHLTMVHYGEEHFDAISKGLAVMASQRDIFPILRRVEVKPVVMLRDPNSSGRRAPAYIVPQWHHDRFASIKSLFEEHGIEFEIIRDRYSRGHIHPFKESLMRAPLDDIFHMRF